MLQLQRKQKTKDGQELTHRIHFRCTIPCEYCGKLGHYEDECRPKRRESKKLKKAVEERTENTGKGKPDRGRHNPGGYPGEGNLVEDEGPQPPSPVKQEHPTPHPRVSIRVTSGLSTPSPALAMPRRARTPRSASSSATLRACRLPTCM